MKFRPVGLNPFTRFKESGPHDPDDRMMEAA